MDLAKIAAEQGQTITAQLNTPLYHLCTTTTTTGNPLVTAVEDIATMPAAMSEASNNVDHNTRFDYFAKQIVESVSAHLAFANNIVVAAINSTATRIKADLGASTPSPSAQFNICVQDLPGPMMVDAFLESVLNEQTISLTEPRTKLKLAKLDGPQALLEMMKTGSGIFDEALVAWWNRKGDTFFMQVWENLFMSASEAFPERTFNMAEITRDEDDGVDAAMAILLIARKLAANPPMGGKLTGGDLQQAIMEYRQVAANRLRYAIDDFKAAETNGVLIKSRNTLKKRLSVYGKVYRQYLKEGGKNETLFGLLVAGSSALTIQNINLEKEKLLRAWGDFKLVTDSRFTNDQQTRFIAATRTAFHQDVRDATEEEKEYSKENPDHLAKVNKLFEQELATVTLSNRNDIDRMCHRLVAKARFYYTDAYKILLSVDEATKANPDLDLKQAETIAAMEYIADFVSAQLVVS